MIHILVNTSILTLLFISDQGRDILVAIFNCLFTSYDKFLNNQSYCSENMFLQHYFGIFAKQSMQYKCFIEKLFLYSCRSEAPKY